MHPLLRGAEVINSKALDENFFPELEFHDATEIFSNDRLRAASLENEGEGFAIGLALD